MANDELDPSAILNALGVSRPTKIAPVTGGSDTAVWRVECADATYALRVFSPGPAAPVQREVLAMRVAGVGGIPVPTVHAEGSWHGHHVLLLSWCSGRPMLDELRSRPWRVQALGTAFGRMHARVHSVTVPSASREQLGSWTTWTGLVEEPLKTCIDHHELRADALLHLDYHLLNVLSDGARITAVLDWANARVGDPRADLARTSTILRVLPDSPVAVRLPTMVVRRRFARAWLDGYRQEAGPIGEMTPFYAWAGTAMVRDLAPKLDRPDNWLAPQDLDRMRRWTAIWERRAGLFR